MTDDEVESFRLKVFRAVGRRVPNVTQGFIRAQFVSEGDLIAIWLNAPELTVDAFTTVTFNFKQTMTNYYLSRVGVDAAAERAAERWSAEIAARIAAVGTPDFLKDGWLTNGS